MLVRTLKAGDITNYPKSKGSIVTIHYEAFIQDEIQGSKNARPEPFDSSRSRNEPFTFRLGFGQVIDGIDVAVGQMSVGQEVEAIIPHSHAYGVDGYPPIVPPRATLVYIIELLRFSPSKYSLDV